MKHIIIPTDFSIRSLQPVHEVARYYKGQPVNIILLHLIELPGGIGDLLFRSRNTIGRYPVPQDFSNACEVISSRYADEITNISVLIRYGSTAMYLENLLHSLGTDAVFVQAGYKFSSPYEDSVDIFPLLRRCDCRLIETSPATTAPEQKAATTIGDLLLAVN